MQVQNGKERMGAAAHESVGHYGNMGRGEDKDETHTLWTLNVHPRFKQQLGTRKAHQATFDNSEGGALKK